MTMKSLTDRQTTQVNYKRFLPTVCNRRTDISIDRVESQLIMLKILNQRKETFDCSNSTYIL